MLVCFHSAKSRARSFVLVGLTVLAAAAPASAQIKRVGDTNGDLNVVTRGVEVAYDPQHQVYLTVGGFGSLYGVLSNTSGVALPNGAFHLGVTGNPQSPFGQFPTVAYSPDVNNGSGGFLVAWHQNDTNQNFLHAVVVSSSGALLSQEVVLSDSTEGGTWYGQIASIAYSKTSQKFLVIYASLSFGSIKGRIVSLAGAPEGSVLTLATAPNGGGVKDPGIAWNSATDEFGVSYVGWANSGGFAGFRRAKGSDGSNSGAPSVFGSGGTFASSVDVNANNHYIMGWTRPPGSQRAEFDQNGNMIGGGSPAAPQLLSTVIGTPTSLSLAFNPQSGTFLAVSEDAGSREVISLELDASGTALGSALAPSTNGAGSGSFYPRTRSRSDAKEWNIAYSRDFVWVANQIINTATNGPTPGGIQMVVDTPGVGSSITPPFGVGGWAIDTRATSDNGIAAIHVWAVPTAGANGGQSVFVGALSPDVDRSDIEQLFGSMHKKSGFGVLMSNLPPGQYMLVFYPQSSFTGQFDYSKVITRIVNVNGSALTQIATPTWGQTFGAGGVGMSVTGYAVDLSAQSGNGVDAVHVWAVDAATGTPTFLGAATLGLQNAQAAAFGASFANGGFSLTNGVSMTPGLKYILVYSHSVGAGAFNFARLVGVFVQ